MTKSKMQQHGVDSPLAKNTPAHRWFQILVQNQTFWTAPLVTVLFSLFVRWAVALNPYSGFQVPPMFGDYEAQRHWMELTIHLPIKKWYRYELQWWGLDYPPLTAYHSWLCGIVGSWINPAWFALDESRGYESPDSKHFMRATVVFWESIIFIPAVLVFTQICYGKQGHLKKNIAALLILLQPALIIIDHGHFQFNNIMLGTTLWAINCFMMQQYALGSFFFCLSLGFKQMALYYAPAVFAFLLGRCFKEPNGIAMFIRLGVTVVATFGVLLSPFLTSVEDIQQVFHRVFPIARGLYEDKVANMWCAVNVVVKLRQLFDLQTTIRLSLVATVLAMLPSVIHLGLNPTRKRLMYGLVCCSMSFFLFSFQVHEKSILLPALPVTLLILEEPWAVSMFINVAMFSMFPLLKREALVLPYFLVTILWNYLAGFHTIPMSKVVKLLTSICYTVILVWHIAESYIPPPQALPDLYTVLNVLFSCGCYLLAFLYFNWRQFNLVDNATEYTDHRKKHQ
ncbi:glycosyl transferase [Umbelopsis sp. AD052]|nr:glycosyl transferase [Umbelopsis sp. AD052]